jgi:hypothetical protein
MQRRFARSIPSTLALAALAACAGERIAQPTGFEGDVTGLITAADMKTPIPGVLVAPWGFAGPTATTNQQGRYTIQALPIGPRTLLATRGHFSAKVPIDVMGNLLTEQPPGVLVPDGKLAFVDGAYDSIEAIVRDKLRNPMTQITAADLANPEITSQYDMIFLNCGLDATKASDASTIANLRQYIADGGILYASDWASAYAQAIFPEHFISIGGSGEVGLAAGSITNQSLLDFVGKSDVQIQYDLGAWKTLDALSPETTVLLTGNYKAGGADQIGKPLAVVVDHGLGHLVYTTFHNEAGVTDDQLKVLYYFIYLP